MNLTLAHRLKNFTILCRLISYMHTGKKAAQDERYWLLAQQKQIKSFTRYIYTIPFYRKRFDEAGITPKDITCAKDFLKLPPLTKDEYRAWIAEEEKNDPKKYQNWVHDSTSGSSGDPLKLLMLPQDRASDIANLFRGILLQKKHYRLFTDTIFDILVYPNENKTFFQKLGILRHHRSCSLDPPEKILREFNDIKPALLQGNKTVILLMAMEALKAKNTVHRPKLVATVAEKMDDQSRKIIEEAFGSRTLYDIYGCEEMGNFAVERVGKPNEYIIWHDTHAVNVVDEHYNSIQEGVGRILITSLAHRGFPMVNYDLRDYVDTYTRNGVRYIKSVIGRENDLLYNADGTVYSWIHVYHLMAHDDNVLQSKMVQEDYDNLTLYLVKNPETTLSTPEIETAIQTRVDEIFSAHPKKVSFVWQDKLEVDKNGKLKILTSKISK